MQFPKTHEKPGHQTPVRHALGGLVIAVGLSIQIGVVSHVLSKFLHLLWPFQVVPTVQRSLQLGPAISLDSPLVGSQSSAWLLLFDMDE
jgi:hypothetical protein